VRAEARVSTGGRRASSFWVTRFHRPSVPALGLAVALATAPALQARALAGARPYADVKFVSPRHQIVVQVKLGPQGPFNMLLDTGTHPSVIDAALAKRLRPPSDTTLHEGQGAGLDPVRAFEWNMVDLQLGKMRVDSVAAAGLDLAQVSETLGMRLDGVLGYGFLEDRIVQIDFLHHRVRFYHQSPALSRSESVEMDMTLDPGDPTPCFTGRIARRDVLLLYDSGSSNPLALNGRAVTALGLKGAFDRARPDSAFGYGGRAETRVGRIPSLVLGAILFENVPCVFGVAGYGESWDPGATAGKLGNALLEGMIVTLDYPGRRIRFER
jgi:aspartyl protease